MLFSEHWLAITLAITLKVNNNNEFGQGNLLKYNILIMLERSKFEIFQFTSN